MFDRSKATLLDRGNGWAWSRVAAKVRRRDHGTCQLCGRMDGPMEVDHIVPRSDYGTDAMDNLRLVCRPCHKRRFAGGSVASGRAPQRPNIFNRARPRVF